MGIDAMRKLFAMLAISLFVGGLAACEEQGPAEQAGDAAEESTGN